MNCVDDGIILGMRTNDSGKDGYSVGDIQLYNQCINSGCLPTSSDYLNE